MSYFSFVSFVAQEVILCEYIECQRMLWMYVRQRKGWNNGGGIVKSICRVHSIPTC